MPDSITCPRCGATSHNLNDVREGYCGRCHDWTTPRPPAVLPAVPPVTPGRVVRARGVGRPQT